ncbi:1200_t:CDS:10 [Ambispora gerdemannii]|uniref:Sorting nexin-4 n=1 Tax=Ambispora gerdemannii TaxID=144530 RepID=A0A9N8V1S2_9GLOM|nr:1200_t:CDS:10 [Ambispora gerdemannii]
MDSGEEIKPYTIISDFDEEEYSSVSWVTSATDLKPEDITDDVDSEEIVSSSVFNDLSESMFSTVPAPFPPPKINEQDTQEHSTHQYTPSVEIPAAYPMVITVTDAKKELDGTKDAFISYLITTKTTLETFTASTVGVRRRFQDFVLLHNALTRDFAACVVPPLPDKHRLEYITGDRFGPEFVEKRRASLQRMLERLARHPSLQKSEYFRIFLESREWNNESLNRQKKGDGVLENLDLEADYIEFGSSIAGLGQLETGIQEPLERFGKTIAEFSDAWKKMTEREEQEYMTQIRDFLNYCHCVKVGENVLKLRDQKQVDFEALSDYLQSATIEHENLLSTGKSSTGFSAYVREKVDNIKGVDHEQVKKERLAKLETKITELKEEVESSNDISNAFSNEVGKEYEVFQIAKNAELKECLLAYTDSHVEFYKQGINLWEEIIPMLEKV